MIEAMPKQPRAESIHLMPWRRAHLMPRNNQHHKRGGAGGWRLSERRGEGGTPKIGDQGGPPGCSPKDEVEVPVPDNDPINVEQPDAPVIKEDLVVVVDGRWHLCRRDVPINAVVQRRSFPERSWLSRGGRGAQHFRGERARGQGGPGQSHGGGGARNHRNEYRHGSEVEAKPSCSWSERTSCHTERKVV